MVLCFLDALLGHSSVAVSSFTVDCAFEGFPLGRPFRLSYSTKTHACVQDCDHKGACPMSPSRPACRDALQPLQQVTTLTSLCMDGMHLHSEIDALCEVRARSPHTPMYICD